MPMRRRWVTRRAAANSRPTGTVYQAFSRASLNAVWKEPFARASTGPLSTGDGRQHLDAATGAIDYPGGKPVVGI